MDTPFEECEKRDTKGLFFKARSRNLKKFTSVDSLYESPERHEIKLDTLGFQTEKCAKIILEAIFVSEE